MQGMQNTVRRLEQIFASIKWSKCTSEIGQLFKTVSLDTLH